MCGGTTITLTITARVKQIRILEYLCVCVYSMFMILFMLLKYLMLAFL